MKQDLTEKVFSYPIDFRKIYGKRYQEDLLNLQYGLKKSHSLLTIMFFSESVINNEVLINKIENTNNEIMYIYQDGDMSYINELLINEMILRFKC